MQAQVNCNDMVNISLSIWDGTADLNAEMFVEGDASQYDELSIDVEQVDCDDIDTPVTVTVTAVLDGVTSTCTSLAVVEDKAPPVPVVTQNLIVMLDVNGEASITGETIDAGSWDNCGSITLSVSPSEFTCADLWQNPVVTLTVEDASGNTNTAWANVVIQQDNGAITCNSEITVNTDDAPILLGVDDMLSGQATEGCSENLQLTITDASGAVVPNNLVTSAYAGTTLIATIENTVGNSCWGQVIVEGDASCGDFTEDNILWPSNISISILGVDSDSLSPANLIAYFGVDPADAMPTINDLGCIIAVSYHDNIFIIDNFSFKVVRTWTIINWNDGSTYSGTQIIDNFPNTDFICDVLPRTAPVGDCDSGHTLDDDAEWPADLNIADYRIKPEELIMYSGVDPLDSAPSFYNTPDQYSATYVDYLEELTADQLTIGREWTATRDDAPGAYWIYLQTIVVDLTAFSNLVTVETMTSRPVPDVSITPDIATDDAGNATVEPTDMINPFLADDPQNGLDIVDMYIIREHVLGINYMDDLQTITADVNESTAVTTLDLVLIERVILGLETEISSLWWFVDKPVENNLSPKAQYIALKPGDVDDSAVLGANFAGENDINYVDRLVNTGETYEIPFYVTEEMTSNGMQFSFNIDNSALEVESVESNYFTDAVTFSQTESGEFNVVMLNKLASEAKEIAAGDAVFTVTMKAKANSVLSWSLSLNENRSSFTINENGERITFNEQVDGEIISGLKDLEALEGVSIYPNPAIDIINLDAPSAILSEGYVMTIVNNAGQIVSITKNEKELDVTHLPSGMYFYFLLQNDKLAKGKFVILK